MRYLLCLIICVCTLGGICQDINGIWRGKLSQGPGGCYPEYYIELQIQNGSKGVSGITYDFYDTTKYIKVDFSGRQNELTKRIVLIESKVLEYKIPKDCVPCVKTYDLIWSRQNNEEVLAGTWKGVEMGTASGCPPGEIFLKKVSSSFFKTEEPLQDPKLAVIQQALNTDLRKIEIVKTIYLDTLNIQVELYDNGQIDGDTISVFLNQQLILYNKRLTDKAIILNIPIREDKDYEMIMYAENLGSIPPNTALMVVNAGKKKYEIYLSSSEQKSAGVRFRYDKKKL